MTASGKWYRRITIHIQGPKGLVAVPLVLLEDGQPGYTINQWIYYLIDGGMGPSSLNIHIRALEHLYAFTMARYHQGGFDDQARQGLIASFIDGKKYGTDRYCTTEKPHLNYLKNLGLNWEKARRDDNIRRYVTAINEFDKWQAAFHRAPSLNPSEKKFLSAWETYQDFKRRKNWDPLLHLHPARIHEKETHQAQVSRPYEHKRRRGQSRRMKKGFPMVHLLKLIDCANNPRDQLLLLLMACGSLRKSEPLHLFRNDIETTDDWGQLRVRLADPEDGMCEWRDEHGLMRSGTRTEYFETRWRNEHLPQPHPLHNLRPRCTYGDRDPIYVGFKGMTFGESGEANMFGEDFLGRNYDVHYVWWLDPRVGAFAQHVYERYRNECLHHNWITKKPMPRGWLERRHPWLFINLTSENYGDPLSYGSLESLWQRLLDRLASRKGVDLRDSGLGMHSLRHFFGWYCASVLTLDVTLTQLLMHHGSVESTHVYFKISSAVARGLLATQYLKAKGYSDEDVKYLIMPGTQKLDWPSEWMTPQLHRRMMLFDHQTQQRKQIRGSNV